MVVLTGRFNPARVERERQAVSTAPTPRVTPEYGSISGTRAVRFRSEPKPTLRRQIVKR